ncbi:MAG TPA: hypothetical protein VNG53_02100 [Bacteroidia bacterium]|nr:hypothetical protein [Bacteroidia bacterium]
MKQISFRRFAIIICLLCAAMIFLTTKLFAQDTIYVKKVFLNNHKIKVKAGYIVHKKNDLWEVNKKEVHLLVYKSTENPEYKPNLKNQVP